MTSRVITTLAALAVAAGTLTAASAAAAPAAPAAPRASSATPRTDLTLEVTGCNGCHLRLTQALNGRQKVWQSRQKTVHHGTVAWRVPTSRTHGMSITIDAPWDGGAGYVPVVVFRYAGKKVGQPVSDAYARKRKRASACWAGTTRSAATLKIRVVHAHGTNPPGDPIRTPRAYTVRTQRWETPMDRAWHGISGTQDAVYCG